MSPGSLAGVLERVGAPELVASKGHMATRRAGDGPLIERVGRLSVASFAIDR
ncbi:MAG: hypothetical protein ACYDEY_16290 [Acidimicrobiales bacterium]